MDPTKDILRQIAAGENLTRDQARRVFEVMMAGKLTQHEIIAVLEGLSTKGESVDELVGAAQAMRAAATRIACTEDCIDTCGTGGDGISTFNVSTTSAIIAAAAGATVAKHGNRSTSRVSGSTEVLTHLGIDVDAEVSVVERSLAQVRIGYLNARRLHPAMRHAAPARAAIKGRTIFNLLGPLTNPAGARRQVLGVPRRDLMERMAGALRALGAAHVWIVHGDDGLCDLTITSSTSVLEVRGETFGRFTIEPEALGFRRVALDDLLVDSPAASAATVQAVLSAEPGPARDQALLNAGAALVVAGRVQELSEGITMAARAIDEGNAFETLNQWKRLAGIRKNT